MIAGRALSAAIMFLLVSCGNQTPTTTAASGVEGRVLAGPTCPVESAYSPCPDRPVETEITVVRESSGAFVKRGMSDSNGDFRIELPPGRYIVSAGGSSGIGGSQPVMAVVEEGKFTTIEIQIDTGIR